MLLLCLCCRRAGRKRYNNDTARRLMEMINITSAVGRVSAGVSATMIEPCRREPRPSAAER